MPVRNLDKIFSPRSVAVIGASRKTASVGRTVLKNLAAGGFVGEIFPVNPKYRKLGDRKCYADVAHLPQPSDLAVICTPAATVPQVVRQCGAAGIRGLVILSAGFREAGAAGQELEQAVRQAAAEFDGMRLVGPNCLGIIAPHSALNASFANGMPAPGRVAFISQSGALCTSVLDWALAENIGFSYFISVGNMLDVGIGDLIDFLALDRWTDSIILYVESITQAREFISAARAFSRTKPIIAYKAGRFAESAQAAKSHTGAMAAEDTVYEAAFHRAGIVRVLEMGDMFDCAELLARQKTPQGPRLAIVTNAGGPGVMAADALLDRKGELAKLSAATIDKLNEQLPAAWSHNNPVDVLGDAPPARLRGALDIVLADPGVDAALVMFTPQAMSKPAEAAQAVIEAAQDSRQPVLTSWMGGVAMRKGIALLNQAGIPTYHTPEDAVRAFMYLVSYARTRQVLYETPRNVLVGFEQSEGERRSTVAALFATGEEVLRENASKTLLEAYEIPVSKPYPARSAEEAVQLARRIGYPVAMKIFSPQITHKTEVGGVALSLAADDQVREKFEQMVASARRLRPDAVVEGVTIQNMVTHPTGFELIVGAKRDPVFGAVMLVGAGGITAELYRDRALELPPLNERLAWRMLRSLRCWPILNGYRGRPAANIDQLIEVLLRISYLIADCPQIQELDVNPLLATPENVIALDARVIVDQKAVADPPRPYAHLAIRPYPQQYIRPGQLKDGTPILLRPIKPEDEPLWHDLLSRCSRESIWFRFRYLFKETTHEMATRFCFIDYDREIAIVAEREHQGQRQLIGVGRVVADADHTNAEYAVLVADDFQNRGLGSVLTDYCLEICRDSGIGTVIAETTADNRRMISLMTHRGFEFDHPLSADSVLGRKTFR